MISFNLRSFSLKISFSNDFLKRVGDNLERFSLPVIGLSLLTLSVFLFYMYLQNGLGLAYNDARSHLDIGRRVVEGLKPGVAQLGSVWLPLDHILMIPLIWNDWLWHSGLAGAAQNMFSFVATAFIIYLFLKELSVSLLGRCLGVLVFVANINVLYLQSTAMTELLLLLTMTLGCYELLLWHKYENNLNLVKSAFWIMLATLTRYDGWFLLAWATGLVALHTFSKPLVDIRTNTILGKNLKTKIINFLTFFRQSFVSVYERTEGTTILFLTLGALGIVLWFAWNLIIFNDPLYFALGPFSAHAQQQQLSEAGVLATKGDLLLSLKVYLYALMYNSYTFPTLFALVGIAILWLDRKLTFAIKLATSALLAPLFFNILALFLGFSVLFVQGISGDTWFNVRYGIMLMPSIAIFVGYLVDRANYLKSLAIGLLVFVLFFAFANNDAVTIDDARVGSSQKNVSEVSGYLNAHALNKTGFILISAASHDAIIFSSGLPMKRFIHEGTGNYWLNATALPDQWARWIVVRTYDDNDTTWKAIKKTAGLAKFNLVAKYPFADVYELKPEFVKNLKRESPGINK